MTGILEKNMKLLNDRQRKAVESPGKRLLILSGAGSGKTRVITTRIAYLIEEYGFSPSSILAVTFTNKAAKEMRSRLEEMVPGAERLMIRTFHSFGAWLLRRNGARIGLPSGFSIYDDQDTLSLLKSLDLNLDRNRLRRTASFISSAKDFALTPEDDLYDITPDPEFKKIYALYEEKIRKAGNVDFGDLISLSVKLLQTDTDIRERIRQRYQAVLVDEYQDSNYAQFLLLQELTGEQTSLCVVGDDDQSIYKFRGALVENIVDFPKYFPGTEIIKLEENYRSTNTILAIASEVIAHNVQRLGKTLWSRNPEGTKAELYLLEDQEDEARFCVDLLTDRQWGGTAILYRTNAQSRVFEKWFRKYNIPYKLIGAISFYSREEIKDALSYLNFLNNPMDEIAFARIINKPARGIGKKSVEKLVSEAFDENIDLRSVLKKGGALLTGKAVKAVLDFDGMLSGWETIEGDHLGLYIKKIIRESGLYEYYRDIDKTDHTDKVGNLEELVSAAAEFPATREALYEFLELIALDQSALDKASETGDQVTLITMHNTKGLEFDRVVVTGLEEGIFPRSVDEDIEEDRRLFYVCITRAREKLYFTACRSRLRFGRYEIMAPSPFIREIPEDKLIVKGNKNYLSPEEEESPYSPGTVIYHEDYGTGQVYKTINNSGHLVIHVRFESGRTGTFLPEFCGHKMDILGKAEQL